MSKHIAVLDIGTTGVRILAAKVNDGGAPHIIAKASSPCSGVKKLEIVDETQVSDAIAKTLQKIKEQTGIAIKTVYVGISGAHISFMRNSECITLPDDNYEITYKQLGRLLDKVASVDIYEDERLVDVLPVKYFNEEGALLDNPIGVSSASLRVEADVILGQAKYIETLISVVNKAGVGVDGFVPSAVALAGLIPDFGDETKSVLMIDVGGSITDYAVYYRNKPCVIGSVPVGGENITKDLEQIFDISNDEAELLKNEYPISNVEMVTNNIDLAVFSLSNNEQQLIKVSQIVEVMQARLENLFEVISQKLLKEGVNLSMLDKVVLCGDAISQFKGLDSICNNIMGIPLVEIDFPRLTGMKNTYTFASGMVMYIAYQLPLGRKQSLLERDFSKNDKDSYKNNSLFNKMSSKLKNMMPTFRE